ncbi:MAG: trehalose-phosphatase [Brevundimonas sp.]|uniref:trehalose-phosphatase n=1 Tax=Brevundimonas sp. TaxID=1871086 RepID=UPI00391A1D5F
MPTDAALAVTQLSPPPALPQRPALFLDMDGVLAPITGTPEGVGPDDRRSRVLRGLLERLGGRVAVVSGRTIAEIDRICEGVVPCVAGIHGLERRGADGQVRRLAPHPAMGRVHEALIDFARDRPGVLIEDKGLGVTLHYRQAPDQAAAARELARGLAESHGLTLQPGDMVQELKTPGADKGRALSAFMDEAPFKGAVPVMTGDDLTDEFAFAAAAGLGGFGVLVGPPRETAAGYGLTGPEAVMDWLETLAERP